ncbi:uncharacterized protein LOC108036177 [Drosophila biarmipes]|uniref:uncharacterized protein LOC108036177 n=1 Tax=Drosophila biarmipes TaxID=125945 RepID=UPI0007E8435C|nr:uncharacterized protein LOC108036177 [Drosophila biarmipes]
MVVYLPLIIFMGLCCLQHTVQAVFEHKICGPLVELVVNHLNEGPSNFNNWTKEISLSLHNEQQERVSWNIPWSRLLEDGKSSLELQKQLKPRNSFKLRLWMSLYWHLKRSQLLNEVLLSNFALELMNIRSAQPELWNNGLQNMGQSFPRSLRLLLRSSRLCLQHQMLFVGSEYHLELGANSNCSTWEVQEEKQDHWLRLVNACDDRSHFFISMLSQGVSHFLFSAPNNKATHFCVIGGLGFFEEASIKNFGCQWHLTDCRFLHLV